MWSRPLVPEGFAWLRKRNSDQVTKQVVRKKQGPNRLLQILIAVSFGIHTLIFLHIAGIYRTNVLSVIELTLRDVSKPPARDIPRPRPRPKPRIVPSDLKRHEVKKAHIPQFKPLDIEPMESNLSEGLMERISLPEIPDSGPKTSEWVPAAPVETTGNYETSSDYFEMVRLRIERYKQYPLSARTRQIEGRTTVRFVITPEGRILDLKVIKHSRSAILDRAAVNAIKKSAPFPKPPPNMFKGPVPLELTIVFELT